MPAANLHLVGAGTPMGAFGACAAEELAVHFRSFRYTAYLAALTAALSCTGGSALDSDGNAGGLPGLGTGADGTGGTGTGPTPGTEPGTLDPTPVGVVGPFAAASPASRLRKVKALLTGGTPTADELSAYQADDAALGSLVDGWLKDPAFRDVLQEFFTMQFQQGQVSQGDFRFQMYDQQDLLPSTSLVIAMRNSFGRTVMALIDEGRPFTEAMTTTRFMMTTELMSYYAYVDTSVLSEAGRRTTRWDKGEANFGPTFRSTGAVSLADSANPSSPQYLTFQWPGLASAYSTMKDANQASTCGGVDPLVVTSARMYSRSGEWGLNVWALLHGGGRYGGQMWWFYPKEASAGSFKCTAANGSIANIYTANDATDWHMVQVRAPGSNENLTEFFDVDRLRNGNVLLMRGERVGFFTTPAFLSQWGTNGSNAGRGAANQALIAALGHQIDGNDQLPLTKPTAVDAKHAADPACFSCHQTLDPLRQFLRQSYTLTYSPQNDATQQALPAAFVFRGKSATSDKRVAAMGDALASHPELARAWTLKLCSWANSAPCEETDPEVQRIASLFAGSNYNFMTMAKALFTSPLVTYAATTTTAQRQGQVASVARRAQLCTTLSTRLAIPNLCNLERAVADGQNKLSSRAAALPGDGYTRGVESALFVTQPEPFYVGNVENICALAAGLAVDGTAGWAASTDPNAAVDKMVRVLMGVAPADAAEPTAALRQHVADARAQGATAAVAVRSALVAACTSAAVLTVGQ